MDIHQINLQISLLIQGVPCPICDGTGRKKQSAFSGDRSATVLVSCSTCKGRGTIYFVDEDYREAVRKLRDFLQHRLNCIGGPCDTCDEIDNLVDLFNKGFV